MYQIALTAKFSSGETQEDTFAINVVAPKQSPKLTKTALFDPKGETAKLLTKMGVSYEKVDAAADLAGYDVLVVGKASLTVDGPAPAIAKVRDGLKVVMFEQTSDVLEKRFGFRVQEYGLRQVFPRVLDHPILAGLGAENLHDWSGEATILPPRLTNFTMKPYFGATIKWCGLDHPRAYRAGNWGNVASVLIEKPARGNFLPLMDGGFSQQFAPLMEYREGKGLVVLCQVDVTGRTEEDPAAARLAANIFDYVSSYTPSAVRKVVYAGPEAGRKHLEQTGLAVVAYQGGTPTAEQVLVVGPGGSEALAANAEALRAWIKAGGNVLAIGLGQQEANAFLPFAIKTQKREYICSVFDPPSKKSLLAGVGAADVMNRDPREIELLTGGDYGPRRRRVGAGRRRQCGLLPVGSLGIRLPEVLQPEEDVPAGQLHADAHPRATWAWTCRPRCSSGSRARCKGRPPPAAGRRACTLIRRRSSTIRTATSSGNSSAIQERPFRSGSCGRVFRLSCRKKFRRDLLTRLQMSIYLHL